MQIDISSITNKSGEKFRFQEVQALLLSDVRFDGPVAVDFTLTNTGEGILVCGTAKGKISLSCASCLSVFSYPMELQISEEFIPLTRAILHDSDEALLDELAVFTYGADKQLDPGEAIRQSALLALPMHPVCRPGCKGLCPACGKNRNEGDCGCKPESNSLSEDLWAPLKVEDDRRD